MATGTRVRETTDRDDEVVVQLMSEYLAWVDASLAFELGVREPPSDRGLIREWLAAFRAPGGLLLLVECDGEPAGVGALKLLAPGVAEVKRMYVAPRFRARHLGAALLDRLLAVAKERGVRVVRLDTVRFMADAQRLYRSRGFVERPPSEETEIPPRLWQHWLFFERSETSAARTAIERNQRRLEAALKAGDAATIAGLFCETGRIVPSWQLAGVNGRQAVQAYYEARFASGRFVDVADATVDVGASGDLAWETGTYRTTRVPDGGGPVSAQGRYLIVWSREADGAWRIQVEMLVADPG